jgi:hypothetical protein
MEAIVNKLTKELFVRQSHGNIRIRKSQRDANHWISRIAHGVWDGTPRLPYVGAQFLDVFISQSNKDIESIKPMHIESLSKGISEAEGVVR